MDYHPSEHPFFMQLFGNDPQAFAEVSKMVEDRGILGVDINMGCPSKKIVNSQHGSALMKDVDGACRIIESIRSACNLEVSVKTRLGWENADNLIPFAKSLEAAGTSLVTISKRSWVMGQGVGRAARLICVYELTVSPLIDECVSP